MKLLGMQTTVGLSAIAIVGLATSQAANAAMLYSVTHLEGYYYKYDTAYDINDAGQVVGQSGDEDGHAPFFWDSTNGVQIIGVYGGRTSAKPTGINNSGQVVGSRVTLVYDTAWQWDSTNGVLQELNPSIADNSGATDINDAGQIVGWYDINYDREVAEYHPTGPDNAFVWDSTNGRQDLGTLGGERSIASGINNAGQVVGTSQTSNGENRAFLWDSTNKMQDLGTLDGRYSGASGINNLGQVVGWSETGTLFDNHAFLWDSTNGMQDLGTLDGDNSFAQDVNDRGQVVGYSGDSRNNYRAFLWDGANGMQDLNDLIDPNSGWILREANAINNRGQIVGHGHLNNDSLRTYAFLLTPISETPEPESVPEPSAGLGLLAFGFLGARKLIKREKSGNCVGMNS